MRATAAVRATTAMNLRARASLSMVIDPRGQTAMPGQEGYGWASPEPERGGHAPSSASILHGMTARGLI